MSTVVLRSLASVRNTRILSVLKKVTTHARRLHFSLCALWNALPVLLCALKLSDYMMDHLLRLKLASIRDKSVDQMAGCSWPRYITHLDLMDQARADAAAVGLSVLAGAVLSCGSLCAAWRRPRYFPVRGVNPAMGVRGQQPPQETIPPSVDGMRSLPQPRSQAKCGLFLFTGPSIGKRSNFITAAATAASYPSVIFYGRT